ncbi:acid-sensing ion channel 2-like isoform X2 [Clytia hemisphaerica]|uniref:Uncharacterized protein n=1 Tax=Clytia hemisphaerica TaxID=252671 RepID=A0A7M5WZQ0_9CNID|eukprot:TCONS_00014475-protein
MNRNWAVARVAFNTATDKDLELVDKEDGTSQSRQENGEVKPSTQRTNGNLASAASIFNKKDSTTDTHPAGTNKTANGDTQRARDRFRQAGMKARLARRMEKIAEDRMTISQIFNRYVDNSTLHGFRFIFMKTFYVRRFLWFALTCGMACLFFMELEKSIALFYQYPFTTLSTIEYVPQLKFPAISLCNLNNYQVSKIRKSKLKGLYEKGLFPFHGEPFDPGFELTGEELLQNMKASSQSIDYILKGCEWKSRDTAKTGKPNFCGAMNFTRFSNLEGQTCYTFNSGINSDILTLNETGLNMAFKLELDLQVKDSVQSLEEVGVNIVIHDQDETPLHHAGFIVSPGFQTFVEMKVKKTENLKPPYATKCGSMNLKYTDDYRQSQCFIEQLNNEVIHHCGCRGEFMKEPSDVPYCTMNETIHCLLPTIHHFDRKTSQSCPVDCETVQYTTALSYGRFLSSPPIGTNLVRNGSTAYINELKKTMDSSELRKYIEENIVVVQFFYQEMKEENVIQEPSYDFYKLVGDVGGQLGLMLGASVLTLVEFVDLFLFTLYHQLLRLSRKKKKESEVKEANNNNSNGTTKLMDT